MSSAHTNVKTRTLDKLAAANDGLKVPEVRRRREEGERRIDAILILDKYIEYARDTPVISYDVKPSFARDMLDSQLFNYPFSTPLLNLDTGLYVKLLSNDTYARFQNRRGKNEDGRHKEYTLWEVLGLTHKDFINVQSYCKIFELKHKLQD